MAKRCLIAFGSKTGNTEKIALRIKETFEKDSWQCDLFKIDKSSFLRSPFDIKNYDFVCIGSGMYGHLPYDEVVSYIRKNLFGITSRMLKLAGIDEATAPVELKPVPLAQTIKHGKILLDDNKYALVFVTYAGYEFGPKEAIPSMEFLALEIEHLGFKCLGKFCCPGKFLDKPMLETFHGDIRHRPDENDMKNAELFVKGILEQVIERR